MTPDLVGLFEGVGAPVAGDAGWAVRAVVRCDGGEGDVNGEVFFSSRRFLVGWPFLLGTKEVAGVSLGRVVFKDFFSWSRLLTGAYRTGVGGGAGSGVGYEG